MKIPILQTTFILMFLNEFFYTLFIFSPALRALPFILMVLSLSLTLYYIFKNYKKINNTHIYFKFLLVCLLFWSLITITKSLNLNTKDLITLFTHYRVGAWSWLSPLAVFFGFSILNWLRIFPLVRKMLVIGIVLALLSMLINIQLSGFILLSLFPILLLTYRYHSNLTKKILIMSMLMYNIYGYFYEDNRSSLIILGLVCIFFVIEYLRKTKNKVEKRIYTILFVFLIGLMSVFKVSTLYDEYKHSKDLSVDTRTFLLEEQLTDMSIDEQIIGRGALGTYYSPYFFMTYRSGTKGGDYYYRSVNEIGYLHMVLKGGYIMMFLYLMIWIPAAYLGIFKSNNDISRMSGYIVLLFILLSILIYPARYSVDFFVLWMAVGTAISPNIRNLTDKQIRQLYRGEKEID